MADLHQPPVLDPLPYQSHNLSQQFNSINPPDENLLHSPVPPRYDSLSQQDSIFQRCANGWVNQLEQF